MVLIIWNYDQIQGEEETDQMIVFTGNILIFISYFVNILALFTLADHPFFIS